MVQDSSTSSSPSVCSLVFRRALITTSIGLSSYSLSFFTCVSKGLLMLIAWFPSLLFLSSFADARIFMRVSPLLAFYSSASFGTGLLLSSIFYYYRLLSFRSALFLLTLCLTSYDKAFTIMILHDLLCFLLVSQYLAFLFVFPLFLRFSSRVPSHFIIQKCLDRFPFVSSRDSVWQEN